MNKHATRTTALAAILHATRTTALAAILALGAAACTPAANGPASTEAPAQTAPLTASGAPEVRAPAAESEPLEWAASVMQIDDLANQGEHGVRLFGLAGGDPAMNGLDTYIAFYLSPADGHRIFSIGNILDYRVLSDSPGRVDLEIHESTMDEASGEIGDQTRRVIVTWTTPADAEAPAEIAVTPAT